MKSCLPTFERKADEFEDGDGKDCHLLGSDHSLSHQRLPKHFTLGSPLEALFHGVSLEPNSTTGHDPTFVIEVAQNNAQTVVFLAQDVLDGDLDVVEGDVRSARGRRIRCLYLGRLNAFASRNEKHRQTAVCAASDSEVVGERSVGDPPER